MFSASRSLPQCCFPSYLSPTFHTSYVNSPTAYQHSSSGLNVQNFRSYICFLCSLSESANCMPAFLPRPYCTNSLLKLAAISLSLLIDQVTFFHLFVLSSLHIFLTIFSVGRVSFCNVCISSFLMIFTAGWKGGGGMLRMSGEDDERCGCSGNVANEWIRGGDKVLMKGRIAAIRDEESVCREKSGWKVRNAWRGDWKFWRVNITYHSDFPRAEHRHLYG